MESKAMQKNLKGLMFEDASKVFFTSGYVFPEWSDGETDPSRTLIADLDIALSAKFEVFEESVVIDNGALQGLFSVSEDEKFRFSR